VRLGTLSQSVLARTHSLSLTYTARAAGPVALAVSVAGARTSATLQVPAGGRRTVSVRLSPAQIAALRRCHPQAVAVRAGGAGTRAAIRPDPPVCGRFFGDAAIWNRPLPADAPLDPDDRAVTYALLRQVADGFLHGPWPTINTSAYTTPVYVVGPAQRRVPVKIDAPSWAARVRAEMARGVPLPAGARPSGGRDGNLVVVQPATNSMWEFWALHHTANGWHARFGGRTTDLRRFPGYYPTDASGAQGASASSLAIAGGLMLASELRRGRIDHALALAIPRTRSGEWALPAQRSDGWDTAPDAVPEGAHFRLDPSLDVASLHLPPVARAMALAAQRYGIYVRDTSGSVAFVAEDAGPYGLPAGYRKLIPSAVQLLKRFPWSHLQLLRMSLRSYSGGPTSAPVLPAPAGPPPVCAVPGIDCG
jgi:hypothetical protein